MNERSPIHLHIEELVLHGFPSGDSQRIGEAFETALQRLWVEQLQTPQLLESSETERINAGEFGVEPDGGAQRLGSDLALAVHRTLFTSGSKSKRRV
jgi:hypothetical protein